MLNLFFFYKRSIHIFQYFFVIKKPEFPYEKLNEQSYRPASAFERGFEDFENPGIGWTFQFPSVIVTSIYEIKQTLHQVLGSKKTKHQFETVHFISSIDAFMAFILTTFYRLYLLCILNACSLYFVLIWGCTLVTATEHAVTAETERNRQGVISFTFFRISA